MAQAMPNYRNPPKLLDTHLYETWVKELKLWAICSKVAKSEQGPAVALSLEGRARDAALELDIAELSADDGLDRLIKQLDGLFLKDENQRTYMAYAEFEDYQRPTTMTIDDYINDFERLYNKVKAFKIELPDQVLAYRLLKSANLEQSKNELVRATIPKLGYKEMKAQLRKLEDAAISKVDSSSTLNVKEEPTDTFFGRNNRSRGRGRSGLPISGRGGYRDRGGYRGVQFRGIGRGGTRGNPPPGGNSGGRGSMPGGSRNPVDESCRNTKCFICKSIFHWARECPHQSERRDDDDSFFEEEVQITLFAKGVDSDHNGRLLGETIGCAVLDSGCTRNVCSESWLDCYIESLNEKERQQISYQESTRKFRFGDNKVYDSKTCVKIPAHIGN